MDLVVLPTDPVLTRSVLRRAVALTAGLQARISLAAVYSMTYPAPFRRATSAHTFLADQPMELAGDCALPVNAQVVLARYCEDGFRYALRP